MSVRPVEILIVVAMLLMVFIGPILSYSTVEETYFRVDRKHYVVSAEGQGKYLVDTHTETLENTDAILHGKFNSSDLQRHLKEGNCYKAKVHMMRIPMLSAYRNILEAEEAKCVKGLAQ